MAKQGMFERPTMTTVEEVKRRFYSGHLHGPMLSLGNEFAKVADNILANVPEGGGRAHLLCDLYRIRKTAFDIIAANAANYTYENGKRFK